MGSKCLFSRPLPLKTLLYLSTLVHRRSCWCLYRMWRSRSASSFVHCCCSSVLPYMVWPIGLGSARCGIVTATLGRLGPSTTPTMPNPAVHNPMPHVPQPGRTGCSGVVPAPGAVEGHTKHSLAAALVTSLGLLSICSTQHVFT